MHDIQTLEQLVGQGNTNEHHRLTCLHRNEFKTTTLQLEKQSLIVLYLQQPYVPDFPGQLPVSQFSSPQTKHIDLQFGKFVHFSNIGNSSSLRLLQQKLPQKETQITCFNAGSCRRKTCENFLKCILYARVVRNSEIFVTWDFCSLLLFT